MATGTTQLLAPGSRHKDDIDVSSAEEDAVDGELPPPVPRPVKDGLPQVSIYMQRSFLALIYSLLVCM